MTQPPASVAPPSSANANAAAVTTNNTTTTSGTTNVSNNTTTSTAGTAAGAVATVHHPRHFGKIVLTLENCLLPEDKLTETPSRQDGLDRQTEIDLRILGCELIQTAGILLKLPQVAMATGQVLFQRFYYSKSFVRHGMETTAMSCVCLASKIEEAPRRIRDVINVFHHIRQVRAQRPIIPMVLDGAYIAHKTQVIKAERRVLKELGFCVHVKHPHKLIVMYLQVLGYEKNQRLMQSAWNYMNDSLRTDVFMRHPPETIACACIYLTARKLALALPSQPPWFGVFRVSEDDIVDVAYRISELYRRNKPNVEALELAVDGLCKRYMDARQRNRPGQGTPPALTTTTTATSTSTSTSTMVGAAAAAAAVAAAAAAATLMSSANAAAGGLQFVPAVATLAVPASATTMTTTADRNNGSHNAWGGFISRTLPVIVPPAIPTVNLVLTATSHTSGGGGGSAAVGGGVRSDLVGANNSSSGNAGNANQTDGIASTRNTGGSRRSRSPRSRSRSPHQRSPGGGGSRGDGGRKKSSHHRSPAGGGGKYSDKSKSRPTRNYSRSASSSPTGGTGGSRHRKRDRKSPARNDNKSSGDYYANGSGGGGGGDRDRDRSNHRDSNSRSNKDRSSGGGVGSGGGSRSGADRDRDRSRTDRYSGSGGGNSGAGRSSGTTSSNNRSSSGKHRERSRDRSRDRKR